MRSISRDTASSEILLLNKREEVVFIENEKIIRDDKEISQYFNEYFAYITDTLNIPKFPASPVQLTGDPVLDAIQIYASHPSVLKIKAMAQNNARFEFSSVDPTLVFSEISNMFSSAICSPQKTSGVLYHSGLCSASSFDPSITSEYLLQNSAIASVSIYICTSLSQVIVYLFIKS